MSKPTVKLIGQDGNVFGIIAKCCRALKATGQDEEFRAKAFGAGSYDEVLQLAMNYCEVE